MQRVLLTLSIVASASADTAWQEVGTLRNEADGFAQTISASGTWMAIGAPQDRSCGELTYSGSVQLYQLVDDAWQFSGSLCSPQPQSLDFFGHALMVAGDLLCIQSYAAPARVHVFRNIGGSWTYETTLIPSVPGITAANFGRIMATDGELLVIADQGASVGGIGPIGAAYVFRYGAGEWQFEDVLVACDSTQGQNLGTGLAIVDGRIFVGATGAIVNGYLQAGAVYVFSRANGQWSEQQKLVANDAGPFDSLGASLTTVNDTIFASAPLAIIHGKASGGIRPFNRNGDNWEDGGIWITTPDAGFSDDLGEVLLADQQRLITSRGFFSPAEIRVFENGDSGWTNTADLIPSGRPSGNVTLLAASQGWIARAAPGADAIVYLFRSGEDCNRNQVIDAVEIASGTVADCDMNGIPDSCDLTVGGMDCDGNGELDTCEIAAGTAIDCNENGTPDACDILTGAPDINRDGVPDECQCLGDLTGDGFVGLDDLGILLANYGRTNPAGGDIDVDGDVDLTDLGFILASFGLHCQ